MKPLYIFDLDGTLALIDHRRHFVECDRDKQDWKAFYAACVDDAPNLPVIKTLRMIEASGADVLFFSGRSDEVRQETEQWILKHLYNDKHNFTDQHLHYRLIMRLQGDYTADHELKQTWLKDMLDDDRRRLVAVFDDRDRVVKMWRDNGVACFQVAPGDF